MFIRHHNNTVWHDTWTRVETSPKLLWTNTNTSEAFGATTISLTSYPYYIVSFKGHKTYGDNASYIVKFQNGCTWTDATWLDLSGSKRVWSRSIQVYTNSIVIKDAIDWNITSNTTTVDNARIIPLHVYGCYSI